MENKRFKNIGFDYKDKYYEFGFGMDEVQRLAALSTATKGKFKNTDFFKIALAQNSKAGFISEKTVQEIMDGCSVLVMIITLRCNIVNTELLNVSLYGHLTRRQILTLTHSL